MKIMLNMSWIVYVIVIGMIFLILWVIKSSSHDNSVHVPQMEESRPLSPPPPYVELPIDPEVPVDDEIPRHDEISQHAERVAKSKGEQLTCDAFSHILGRRVYQNIRPNFLKNPETGRNLEIDCYDPDTQIGIEYMGIQHYVYPNRFMSSQGQFIKQLQRDNLKLRLCEQHDIYIIRIPYTVDSIYYGDDQRRYEAIYHYITEHLTNDN